MDIPSVIINLVERFGRNFDTYKRDDYKETRVRVEFIDPFFEALGWDVRNVEGYSDIYKDVIHEAAITISGKAKAPDYSFRVGGVPKFFLEAKKPSVQLKEDIGPAYQVRRYAWNAKLPLSILTDFEEFAVYDCRILPKHNDSASVARVLYFSYKDYIDRWDEIFNIFAKESVLKGSFDRFAQETKKKRGTSDVDSQFLKEIESWRDTLARNIALRNPNISVHELNFAVQKNIDRIIFLRISEDRGIEEYGRLLELTNRPDIYKQIQGLYKQADDKYNAGLFDFQSDTLTESLEIDDKVIKPILTNLYYPNSPYEFSVLPADILGHVYEQFLGKLIRLTPGHRAKIEEKPEVKKAGGVFYTPTYIVDYIVEQTVGRLIEGKTPSQVSKLRILDPACGSGSFLLGAYQNILNYILQWYISNDPEKHAKKKTPTIFQDQNGDWRLTTSKKKQILLNNIHGVDIDRQAVEVTKLSLLLKVLEGENEESLGQQIRLWQERALPDLGKNIKCGNSLISPKFFNSQLLPDEVELRRVNPFDWHSEFPLIMDMGGFDIVIGNPPYIRIQTMKEWASTEVEFYKHRYKAARKGNYDIYVVFVERALELLNQHGRMGFILPHKFFQAKYGQHLRELISNGRHLSHVIHFGDQQVFQGATTYTCLLFLDKKENKYFHYGKAHDLNAWRVNRDADEGEVLTDSLGGDEWNIVVGPCAPTFERLRNMQVKLGDVASIFQGLVTGADQVFLLKQIGNDEGSLVRVIDANDEEFLLEREILKVFIKGNTVSSFSIPKWQHRIIFPYNLIGNKAILISKKEMIEKFPRTWDYLKNKGDILRGRERGKWNHSKWYALGRSQNLTKMEEPKLITQVISLYGRYSFDDRGLYFTGGGNGPYYGIRWSEPDNPHSLHYLQAVLSSRLLDFYLQNVSSPFRGGYWSYGKRFIEQLPIRIINFNDPADVSSYGKIVALVDLILELNQKLIIATVPADKKLYNRQIRSTNQQVESLVNDLYELTDNEITIIDDFHEEKNSSNKTISGQ